MTEFGDYLASRLEVDALQKILEEQIRILVAERDRLRNALDRIQAGLAAADNAENVQTVGRAREIALAALNQ